MATTLRLGRAAMLPLLLAMVAWGPAAMAQSRSSQARSAPATPAQGQAPAAGSRVTEEPERTSAVYGDWTVTCVATPGRATPRTCEMVQTMQDSARQISAAIAVGRLTPDAPYRLVVRVPVNVQVTQPANLMVDSNAVATLAFRTCLPIGCFAELELRDDAVLRRLRERPADQAGQVEWSDSTGGKVALPFSVRGFGVALDALGRS